MNMYYLLLTHVKGSDPISEILIEGNSTVYSENCVNFYFLLLT